MITEDYVSFAISKLLKEKKFNWDCITYYVDSEPNGVKYSMLFENNTTWEERCYSAPTLQMAMKWLREVHNIIVEPFIQEDTKYVWYIHRIETILNKKYLVFCWASKKNKYERPEEACEAAIKYCLENLI